MLHALYQVLLGKTIEVPAWQGAAQTPGMSFQLMSPGSPSEGRPSMLYLVFAVCLES